ncbi:MAG: sel1 repeat family protein [Muribaculaceae bacterium]|nr:sel1 repeat family protein [Muribaculaceae bacterium]
MNNFIKQWIMTLLLLIGVTTWAEAHEGLQMYGRGVELVNSGNVKEGILYLEKALGLGITDAAYMLGECYMCGGKDVGKNYPKAQNYYRLAATTNNPDAEYRHEAAFSLYIMHEMGVSTLDKKEAAEYLCAAANGGVVDAIYELARYYKHHAQFGQAQNAMADAASKGSIHAMSHLGIAWYEGDSIWTGDRTDYHKAFDYLNQFVEIIEESPRDEASITPEAKCAAYITLSKCYRFGRGVNVDKAKADEYVRKAAKYGDPNALNIKKLLNI